MRRRRLCGAFVEMPSMAGDGTTQTTLATPLDFGAEPVGRAAGAAAARQRHAIVAARARREEWAPPEGRDRARCATNAKVVDDSRHASLDRSWRCSPQRAQCGCAGLIRTSRCASWSRIRRADPPISRLASWPSSFRCNCRSGSSSTIAPGRAASSAPSSWRMRRRTAIRCCSPGNNIAIAQALASAPRYDSTHELRARRADRGAADGRLRERAIAVHATFQ